MSPRPALLVLIALAAATQATARENRVLRCKTSVARAAPSQGGAALVANIPRSLTPIDLNAVQMIDKRLARSMVVEGLWAQRTNTDALLVTARFVNCTNQPLVLRARSSFMNQAQIPTEAISAWRTIFIPPLATGIYQERSLGTTNVANYLIELQGDR